MRYKIQSENFIFFAEIIEDYEDFVVFFGNYDIPHCVTFYVKYGGNHTLNNIHFEKYDVLLKNEKAFIEMIQSSIKFISMLFPTDRFSLSDMSQAKCIKKYNVKLADIYFLIYGETWYERHLKASPNFFKYEKLKQSCETQPLISFDDIWDGILADAEQFYKHDKQYYAELFENSLSWREFFYKLYCEESCAPFMNIFNCVNEIISFICPCRKTLYGSEWYIPKSIVDTYPDITYTLTMPNELFPNLEYDFYIEDFRRKIVSQRRNDTDKISGYS